LSLALNTVLYSVVKNLSGAKAIGERFDPAWIAGKGCLVQITHSVKQKLGGERTYANIEAITTLPQGLNHPPGSCVVWTIAERAQTPLPDVSFVPPLYHEGSSGMRTVSEWVNLSSEVHQAGNPVSGIADSRMAASTPAPASPSAVAPATQGEEIPF
jgi:hypothetical protein